jgi:hypothetical protein
MEVKDAIKFLESIGYSASGYGNSYISGDTEKYETPTSLGVRFVEVRKLTENKAYEGMWEELKKGYSRDGVYFYHDCSDNNDEYVNDVIRELEKKYQQKHYPEVGNE